MAASFFVEKNSRNALLRRIKRYVRMRGKEAVSMIYLAESLKKLRREKDMTQEEVAQALNVAPQTVSKWERGENCPDIELLPGIAYLLCTSVDQLLGVEQLRNQQEYGQVYTRARVFLRRHEWKEAVDVYRQALKRWPADPGLRTDLAMALALVGGEEMERAAQLLEQVMDSGASVKLQHTARAALCYLRAKQNRQEEAFALARQLPHQRESREVVAARLNDPALDAFLYELSTGEEM